MVNKKSASHDLMRILQLTLSLDLSDPVMQNYLL